MPVMSFTLLLTIWLNIWISPWSHRSRSQNFSKSTWIHSSYLFERLQNRPVPGTTTKVSCQKKNDSNFTSTTWVCIASSRSWNGQTELWLYDSVVASFQLYELTFERSFHVFLRWFRVVPEHCVHGHHHSRSTKAALDSVVLHHALLHGNISCIFFIKEAIFPIITFFYLNWNSD